jgi:GNAT superfamily N-acetyltransferase
LRTNGDDFILAPALRHPGRAERHGRRSPAERPRSVHGESIVAGLAGETYSGWLFIRYLWISDALRGQGIGRKLMGDAEARALERGCHSAWVDTFSFQAPGFYPRLGYEVFGELEYPPGHKRIFLQKRLG